VIKFQAIDLIGDGKYRWDVTSFVQSNGERACTYSGWYKLLYSPNCGVTKLWCMMYYLGQCNEQFQKTRRRSDAHTKHISTIDILPVTWPHVRSCPIENKTRKCGNWSSSCEANVSMQPACFTSSILWGHGTVRSWAPPPSPQSCDVTSYNYIVTSYMFTIDGTRLVSCQSICW